jgi:hypothetical protein
MSKNFLIAIGIGIVCIAIAVAGILYMQRGARVGVSGEFLKVRTAPLDENSTIVVVDFRVKNPSDYPFVARSVTLNYQDPSGNPTEGITAPELDAKHIFEGIPTLGQKYSQTLIIKDTVPAKSQLDRMVMARFDLPEARLQSRKQFVIKIEEIDGQTFEISEKPQK